MPCILRLIRRFCVQICYAAKTWYGDLIYMMIFGVSEVSGDVDLGEETRTMVCKFVIRSSSGTLVDEITADVQSWLDDLTDCAVRVVSDEEVQVSGLITSVSFCLCHERRRQIARSWPAGYVLISAKPTDLLVIEAYFEALLCGLVHNMISHLSSPGIWFLNSVTLVSYNDVVCNRLQLQRN